MPGLQREVAALCWQVRASPGTPRGWQSRVGALAHPPLQKINQRTASPPSPPTLSSLLPAVPLRVPHHVPSIALTPTFALSTGKTQRRPPTAGAALWGFFENIYKDLIVERKNGISFPFTFQGSPNPPPLVQKHTGKGFLFCLIRFKGIFVWG